MMADMALIVAHRIRGLVTTIEGFTDLLADTLASREQRELALRIFESAARIESVLADLQMFARPVQAAAVGTTVEALLVDLHAAVDEDLAGRLEVQSGGGDVRLLADRMLIRQALLVLVQNAADASSGDEAITVEWSAAEGMVHVHVRNPTALHPDVRERAFEPFFTTKAHNLGVGLPIASRIAQSHAGSVELAYSDPEGGTCFTLTLPADGAGEVGR